MDAAVDYLSSPYLSDVDVLESTPEGKKATWEILLEGALRMQPQCACHVHWHVLGSRRTLPWLTAPGVFVNVIASNCCPYSKFKTHHFISRNAPNEEVQDFAARSNVLCQDNLNIRHPWSSCSYNSNCSQVTNFSAHSWWRMFRENTVLSLHNIWLLVPLCHTANTIDGRQMLYVSNCLVLARGELSHSWMFAFSF